MSEKSKKLAAFLAMSAAISMDSSIDPQLYEPDVTPSIQMPKKPPIGAKEYFFNAQGEFDNHSMRKDECVFICYAINDKNALRKFKKWNTEN